VLLFYNGPEFSNDYGFQLGAARHLVEGNHISIAFADNAAALDEWTYPRLRWWPPGHTIATALFLPLTQDVWWAAYSVEVIYTALFFFAWYIIIEFSSPRVTPRIQTGIWLTWLLLLSPLTNGTNQGALAFYSLSLAGLLALIRWPRYAVWLGFFCGVSIALALSVRYAYLPLVVVFPLIVGGVFWVIRDRRLLAASAAYSIIVVAGMIFLTFFMQEGGSTAIDSIKGFYWENLLSLHPFPAVSVGGNGIEYIVRRFGLPAYLFSLTAWGLSVVLTLLLIRATWRSYRESSSESSALMDRAFWSHGCLTIGLVVASLAYLSLRSAPQGGIWTYVEEMRYFAPTWTYFTMALAVFVSETWPMLSFHRRLRTLIIAGFAACLLLQGALRGVNFYSLIRKLPLEGGETRILVPSYRMLRQASEAGHPVIYMTCDHFEMSGVHAEVALARAAIYGGSYSSDLALDAEQPVTVVMGLPKRQTATCFVPLTAWIERYGAVKIGEIADFVTFYSVELPQLAVDSSNE